MKAGKTARGQCREMTPMRRASFVAQNKHAERNTRLRSGFLEEAIVLCATADHLDHCEGSVPETRHPDGETYSIRLVRHVYDLQRHIRALILILAGRWAAGLQHALEFKVSLEEERSNLV